MFCRPPEVALRLAFFGVHPDGVFAVGFVESLGMLVPDELHIWRSDIRRGHPPAHHLRVDEEIPDEETGEEAGTFHRIPASVVIFQPNPFPEQEFLGQACQGFRLPPDCSSDRSEGNAFLGGCA